MTIGHIKNQHGDSLADRVQYFRSATDALKNIQRSADYMDNHEWADRLGDREDVEDAKQIIEKTHRMATSALEYDDFDELEERGLMTKRELQSLARLKRQHQSQIRRDKEQLQDKQEDSHSQKRGQ